MTAADRAAMDALREALGVLLGSGAVQLHVRVAGPSRLTADQVAEVAGVSRSTVWRWVASGRLPAPVGQRWERSAVEKALTGRKEVA